MGPSCIFIVRHGHRIDQMNPGQRRTMPRPHDSSLTDEGKNAARALGRYLKNTSYVTMKVSTEEHGKKDAKPAICSNIVVLTSPLVRCVETSHGIVEGLLNVPIRLTNEDKDTSINNNTNMITIPIYLEPGMLEGEYWMNNDIKMAKKEGNSVEEVTRINPVTPNNDKKYLHDNFPVYMNQQYFIDHVSPFVQTDRFRCDGRGNKIGFADVVVKWCPEKRLIKEEQDVKKRVYDTAKAVANSPSLGDKIVIVVGHGETTGLFYKALTGDYANMPDYTGWSVLVPTAGGKWKQASGRDEKRVLPHIVTARAVAEQQFQLHQKCAVSAAQYVNSHICNLRAAAERYTKIVCTSSNKTSIAPHLIDEIINTCAPVINYECAALERFVKYSSDRIIKLQNDNNKSFITDNDIVAPTRVFIEVNEAFYDAAKFIRDNKNSAATLFGDSREVEKRLCSSSNITTPLLSIPALLQSTNTIFTRGRDVTGTSGSSFTSYLQDNLTDAQKVFVELTKVALSTELKMHEANLGKARTLVVEFEKSHEIVGGHNAVKIRGMSDDFLTGILQLADFLFRIGDFNEATKHLHHIESFFADHTRVSWAVLCDKLLSPRSPYGSQRLSSEVISYFSPLKRSALIAQVIIEHTAGLPHRILIHSSLISSITKTADTYRSLFATTYKAVVGGEVRVLSTFAESYRELSRTPLVAPTGAPTFEFGTKLRVDEAPLFTVSHYTLIQLAATLSLFYEATRATGLPQLEKLQAGVRALFSSLQPSQLIAADFSLIVPLLCYNYEEELSRLGTVLGIALLDSNTLNEYVALQPEARLILNADAAFLAANKVPDDVASWYILKAFIEARYHHVLRGINADSQNTQVTPLDSLKVWLYKHPIYNPIARTVLSEIREAVIICCVFPFAVLSLSVLVDRLGGPAVTDDPIAHANAVNNLEQELKDLILRRRFFGAGINVRIHKSDRTLVRVGDCNTLAQHLSNNVGNVFEKTAIRTLRRASFIKAFYHKKPINAHY